MRERLGPAALASRLPTGDRAALGQAITLVESRRPDHRRQAQELLELLPVNPDGVRVGISGPPGVGKSTFIEALGMRLVEDGSRVAVLAVDPSSERTGGSILADKTRMQRLSRHSGAFIRPSPSAGALGGVGRRTRETLLVCEAAGYDVVLVETVGVGQSEAAVAMMVDTFLLLMLAGAGDEIQGIKRGVLEWADILAVTKADGDNRLRAATAAGELRSALSLFTPRGSAWTPSVHTVSAREGAGIDDVWRDVLEHRSTGTASGVLAQRRKEQLGYWLRSAVEDGLKTAFEDHSEVKKRRRQVETRVIAGEITPTHGALELLRAFGIDSAD